MDTKVAEASADHGRDHGVGGAAEIAPDPETEQRMVSLHLCRYGQDFPDGPINPRKHDRWASEQLIASVREDGIIQPPLAKEHDGKFYFAAGSWRLHALFSVHAAHINDKGYPTPWARTEGVMVPIIMRRNGNPLALGLQENLNRNNLHPVDKMEGFSALLAGRAQGTDGGIAPMTVEAIAAHYSMRPAQVRTSLRLGRLAPAIREAWRAGSLDAPTAEAFILCKDEKSQVKLFERLTAKAGPGGSVTPHMVRSALKAQPGEVRRLLGFVGRDTALANGIEVSESLFSFAGVSAEEGKAPTVIGEPTVHNVGALKAMAESKLGDAAVLLTKLPNSEGGPWGWALAAHDPKLPKGWESWPRMVLDRKLTIKDRLAVGCVVSIDGEGALHTEEAIYWSESTAPKGDGDGEPAKQRGTQQADSAGDARTAEGGAAGDFGSEAKGPASDGGDTSPAAASFTPPAITPADGEAMLAELSARDLPPRLQQQLAEQLTAALAKAVSGEPSLAVPLILAALVSHGEVIRIVDQTRAAVSPTYDFAEALDLYVAMKPEKQLQALASVVSAALLLTIESGEMPPAFMSGPQALIRALERVSSVKALRRHLVGTFDVEAYVKGAPAPALLAAIGEACGEQQREKMGSKGKRALQDFARVNLAEQKWLPAEMGADLLGLLKTAARVGAVPRKAVKAAANPSARLLKRKAKKGRR